MGCSLRCVSAHSLALCRRARAERNNQYRFSECRNVGEIDREVVGGNHLWGRQTNPTSTSFFRKAR